jgi:hypothetical protein
VLTAEELPAALERAAASGRRPAALGDPTDAILSLLPADRLATTA